jgi:hypothetical protein
VEVFFSLADARRKLAIWLHDYNQHGHTRHWPIARQMNLQLYAAVDMTAIRPPWKTLRVYHISTARRRLAVS